MNCFEIGKYIRQTRGYDAFIPNPFPPAKKIELPSNLNNLHNEAIRVIGKMDGIATLLPDLECFLIMMQNKDAASSSQIEGTNATMMDVIELQNESPNANLPDDVDDIVHYIKALKEGMLRIKEFPLSLRFIRELHKTLLQGARATHAAFPGEFRTTQNWIGGVSPEKASFVPPPVYEMNNALSDLEKFIHAEDNISPLVKAGLLHAQFETIHPFTDGNGRTGRMLITFFLMDKKQFDTPILYLSSFFKKYRNTYYERLSGYHAGKVFDWLEFFFDGVVKTANSTIKLCKSVTSLREKDMQKLHALGKTSAKSTEKVLINLYNMPIVGIADIVKWTGFTEKGGYKVIERLVNMNILNPSKTDGNTYGQKWIYSNYMKLFIDDDDF
jgi:Fic family protein